MHSPLSLPSSLQPRFETPPPRRRSLTTQSSNIRRNDDDCDDHHDDDDLKAYVDENDDLQHHEEGPREVPWLETVEEVLKRIRNRNSHNESQRSEPEDGFPSHVMDDEPLPSALEVSLTALATTARVLLEKHEDDDDDDDRPKLDKEYGGGFPSLQPLDVQIVPDEKSMTGQTRRSPVSTPGAHRIPGPSTTSSERPVAVAVDWTNVPPAPPLFNPHHMPVTTTRTTLHHHRGYEVTLPPYSPDTQTFQRIGSPMSDMANESSASRSSHRRHPPQPTPQQPSGHRPHWIYVPSSTSMTSQEAVGSTNHFSNTYIDSRHRVVHPHGSNQENGQNTSTSAVVPSQGRRHRFRDAASLVAPSFFGISLQRGVASNTNTSMPNRPFSQQQHATQHPDRPLEATVVRDDIMDLTRAEPVMPGTTTLTTSPHNIHTNGASSHHQQFASPWQLPRASRSQEREPSTSSSLDENEIVIDHSKWSKWKHTLVLVAAGCLAFLIVIILVLAMVVYHNGASSSSSSAAKRDVPTLAPSSAPTVINNTVIPMTTWQAFSDCGSILGTSVALSSDGSLLATGASTAASNTTSTSFVNAYLMNGNQCVQLGDTIQTGAAVLDSLPFPPLALSNDGYTLAVGTTNRDNTGGGIAMYKFTNDSWNPWGESIAAWTNTNSTGGIGGWSVAMSSDGLRLATGVIQQGGSNQASRGLVRVFQYIVEEQQWTVMGNSSMFNSHHAIDNLSSWSVHLSSDGKTLAIGAMTTDPYANGILHVQVYQWNQTDWYTMGAALGGACDLTRNGGDPVALSEDGQVLAQSVNGSIQVMRYNGTEWNLYGNAINGDEGFATFSGVSLALADSGMRLAVGMPQSGNAGIVWVFQYDDNHNDWIPIGNVTTAPFGDEYFGAHVALNIQNGVVLAVGSEDLAGDGSGHVSLFAAQGLM